MSIVAGWLLRNKEAYLTNASTARDFRSQLRGNRPLLLWGTYLFILIGFGTLFYAVTSSEGTMSVASLQRELQGFYNTIMNMLGLMVGVVAPALTATTIVSERQKRSLDLIFSAPVSTKYYLVGKMISSYRYTWMLLVLSLPVTSVCVVLGGATWTDVLTGYANLSFIGIILTSIALALSTVAIKPVSAIVWSYFATFFVVMFTWTMASFLSFASMRSGRELPFLVSLSPFNQLNAAGAYTQIGWVQIPNFVLAGLTALLVSRIMLLGASSVLSPFGALDTKSLRVHGLVYMFVVAVGVGSALGSGSTHILYTWITFPLIAIVPIITCFGWDLEKKFWPDGWFSIRAAIVGTPAGGLPYLLGLLAGAFLGSNLGVGLATMDVFPDLHLQLCYLTWALGLWAFIWAIGRGCSSLYNGVKTARTLQAVFFLVFLTVPSAAVSMIVAFTSQPGLVDPTPLWYLMPLYPLGLPLAEGAPGALAWGLLMLLAALYIGRKAEHRARNPKPRGRK